jgi:hypothetical protein
VRCVSRFSNGRTVEDTYVIWYELTLAVLLAACTWLVLAALLSLIELRHLGIGAVAAGTVFTAATVLFFL